MLQRFLSWLGFGLCHQLPERSYLGGGIQASVCSRDTGIYLGFLIAFVLLLLLHRGRRPTGFPPLHVWIAMGLSLAFMGWDGISSYGGFRETTNALRLATGVSVGFSVAAVTLPMLNDELWADSSRDRVLSPPWRFAVWLAAMPAAWAVVTYLGPLLGVFFVVAIAAAILFTLSAVNLIILAMIPAFDRKGRCWRDVVVPSTVALALTFIEIALSNQFRYVLLSLAGR